MVWFVTRLFPFIGSPLGLRERRLLRDLKVKRRGRNDGRRNHPATSDTQLSETEQNITAAFDNAANELRQAWIDRWRRGGRKFDAQAFTAQEEDYATPVTEARAKMNEDRQEQRDRMIAARMTERAVLRGLRLFQQKHDLDREAKYPDVPLMAFAILFALTIGESAVNANLFAQVSDWGLTGGLFYALGMALPNVLGGALIGFFAVRAAIHINWLIKTLGIMFTVVGVGALLFYNFYLGHYRALLTTNPDSELGAAWPRLFSDPLAFLASRDAVILLFVGIAAAILALWKGAQGFSDMYFGYADIDRTYKKALAAYEDSKTAYRSSMNAILSATQKELKRRIDSVDKKVKAIMKIVMNTLHDLEVVHTGMQASAQACRSALTAYRQQNLMVRTTKPPAFFEEFPEFDDKLPNVEESDFVERRTQILTAAKTLHQNYNRSLEQLVEHANAFMERVDSEVQAAESEADERRARDHGQSRTSVPQASG